MIGVRDEDIFELLRTDCKCRGFMYFACYLVFIDLAVISHLSPERFFFSYLEAFKSLSYGKCYL